MDFDELQCQLGFNADGCRQGGEDFSHIQFKPKLWSLRPIVKVSREAILDEA